MSAAAHVAAIRDHWPTALRVLHGIPAAVADKSMPLKDLHYMASQAEVDCGRASMYTPDYEVDGRAGFAPESRKVLVNEFKVGWPWGYRGHVMAWQDGNGTLGVLWQLLPLALVLAVPVVPSLTPDPVHEHVASGATQQSRTQQAPATPAPNSAPQP